MCKKKKDEVNEMEITYKVEARCNQVSGINVEFKGIGDINLAFAYVAKLKVAFPDIVVTCEQTGEIIYSHYISLDFFEPTCKMGKAIFDAECVIRF